MNLVPQVTQVLESSSGQQIPVLDKLSQISSLVQQVEVIGQTVNMPGPQKAAAIAPLVAQAVMSSELIAGKKLDPAKQAKFLQACQNLGGDVADILNCLEPVNNAVPTEQAPPVKTPVAVLVPAPKPAAAAAAPAPAPAPAAAPAPAPIVTQAPADLPGSFQSVAAQIPDTPGVAAAIATGLDIPQE
jgi:hypothetical protein